MHRPLSLTLERRSRCPVTDRGLRDPFQPVMSAALSARPPEASAPLRALQDCLALAAIFVTTDSVAVLQARLTQ